jgi:hypothetical protein
VRVLVRNTCICVIFTFFSGSVYADFLVLGYDSTNPNGANGPPAPDLAAAEHSSLISPLLLSRGAGVTANTGITFNSSNWSLANTVDFNSNQYIQWGWSAGSQSLDLTTMTLQYDVSPSGPSQLTIALSVNSGGFQPIFTDTSINPSDETATIDLSAFNDVDSAIFRLFGYSASSSGGTLDIEEIFEGGARGILIRGDLAAVPEPSIGNLLPLLCWLLILRPRVMACAYGI